MDLSLSPGESVTPANGSWVAAQGFAKLYRVTQDLWDVWRADKGTSYPTDVVSKLNVARDFAEAGLVGANGSFPDLDMMPIGRLGSHGKPSGGREGPAGCTHLTASQARFASTLWGIARAPLVYGAYLPLQPEAFDCDKVAQAIMWNQGLPTVHALGVNPREVSRVMPARSKDAGVGEMPDEDVPLTATWVSGVWDPFGKEVSDDVNVAVLNTDSKPRTVTIRFNETGLVPKSIDRCWCTQDVWYGTDEEGKGQEGPESSPVWPPGSAPTSSSSGYITPDTPLTVTVGPEDGYLTLLYSSSEK